MTRKLGAALLLVGLAVLFLTTFANAVGRQIDTDLDEGAYHSSLGDLDGDGDLDMVTSAEWSGAFTIFLNNGNGNFAPGSQIDTELDEFANHSSLGDLDGDGDLDLVTSASGSGAFTVFLGKGDGTFGPGRQIDTDLDEGATHTSLGDLDGDGDLDLVTSAYISDAFTVFLGNGDGTFGSGSQIDTELDQYATHTSLGDLNGDGSLDLITSARDASAFVVFLGHGDGTFSPGRQLDTELDKHAVHTSLGDLDGDGDLDLVTAAYLSKTYTVFLGNGDGTFESDSQIDAALNGLPVHTSLGDVDGDGDLDLVTLGYGIDAFTIFLGSGDGAFRAGTRISAHQGGGFTHASLGDLDGDGNLDLVTSASEPGAFTIFLGDSGGTFGLSNQIDTELDWGANHTSLGDLDGDGDLDLVTSAQLSDAFTVFLNDGDGTFGPGRQIDTELDGLASHTSLGDLDGDSDLDLITSGFSAFTVFLNSGDGTFGPGSQIDTELDESAVHSSLGDLDGDGDLDLVTSAAGSDAFTVFLNSGDGTFGPGRQIDTELDEGATHSSLGDLDRDGHLDLVTSAQFSDAFTIFLGKGDGTFGQGAQIDTVLDDLAKHSSLGDLNGDGNLDLVTSAGYSINGFTVFLGNGDGTFGPGRHADGEFYLDADHTSLGDLDEDGDLDLVSSARASGTFKIFLNDGDGNFGPGSKIDTELDMALTATHTSLGDLDGDGDLDIITSAHLLSVFRVNLRE